MQIHLQIFHLAILRAAVEGKPIATYFGSTMALAYWLEETKALDLVVGDINVEATQKGVDLYRQLRLNALPEGRATFWSLDLTEVD